MLKKILTLSVFVLAMCTMVHAQKERMYVRAFTHGESVSAENCEKVRKTVLDAVNASDYFELFDAYEQAAIAQELEKRQEEAMMHDSVARNEHVIVKANNYIMEGEVFAFEIKEKVIDGKKAYACTYNISVTILKIVDNTTITKNFSNVSETFFDGKLDFLNNKNPEEAIKNSLYQLYKDIKNFIIIKFPLKGTILGEDFEIKKDKLTQCYISLGRKIGVKVGDFFDIFEIKVKVGIDTKWKIGRMKIVQVEENMALGKVTEGKKEVKLAMDRFFENQMIDEVNAKPLVVISSKKREIFDLIKDF